MVAESKTVIVTGASKGLGRAAALILGDYPVNIVLTARSAHLLEKTREEITNKGGAAIVIPGDISSENDCRKIIYQAIESFGNIDAIINNAGVIEPITSFVDADLRDWQRNIEINIIGPANLTKPAIPFLRKSKGRIINVSSGAAVQVIPGWSAYCTTKAALNHFTRVIAVEEPAITSIAVRPGVVATDMQLVIREKGVRGMPAEIHQKFMDYFKQGALL
ncbi:MAG: SDR family NAD(P)-dependent oxidoreductase, partial [Chloroflexota bacterium]